MEPKIGKYYYHYKHDPNGPVNKYAYEIINFGHHTEIDGLEESKMVAYAPLYEDAGVYRAGKHWDLRPIKMFTELVHKDGKSFERFTEIIDERIISELDKIKKELYG
ncbi:MAG: DUF1653 domain-containing protein [Candidatus Paceibacterota bacterium]